VRCTVRHVQRAPIHVFEFNLVNVGTVTKTPHGKNPLERHLDFDLISDNALFFASLKKHLHTRAGPYIAKLLQLSHQIAAVIFCGHLAAVTLHLHRYSMRRTLPNPGCMTAGWPALCRSCFLPFGTPATYHL